MNAPPDHRWPTRPKSAAEALSELPPLPKKPKLPHLIGTRVTYDMWLRLHILCNTLDRSVQSVTQEAFRDLFDKYKV